MGRPIVLDFSSLWAGPLAGSFLADAGARVIKVEGEGRPDGARSGPAAFYDLLNAGKETITIDFGDRADQALLRRMVAAADLVIEASRPRAMAAVGLDPSTVVEASATSWLSITGHGRIDTLIASGSATMQRWRADSGSMIPAARCSWPTPSPTQWRAWLPQRSPPSCWSTSGLRRSRYR